MVGGKVDECLKGNNSLDCNAVSKDCILPSEDANVRAEYTSTTHDETSRIPERVQTNSYREETSQKCVGNDKGENWTPKRKSIVTDKCSDVTATLVYKRIRRTSNVDQPTSKSTDEKSRAKIMEGIDTVVSSRQCDVEAECQLIDNVVVNECTTSDHLEVVHKTTTENTSSPVTSVSRPVNRIDPKEKMQPLPSSRNKDVSSEDAISSQI
ncbi:hypothetical protein P8452_13526 [Trifolium repens]|nr:hypothetical protein P8452_13526 [Trifolium repens]